MLSHIVETDTSSTTFAVFKIVVEAENTFMKVTPSYCKFSKFLPIINEPK